MHGKREICHASASLQAEPLVADDFFQFTELLHRHEVLCVGHGVFTLHDRQAGMVITSNYAIVA